MKKITVIAALALMIAGVAFAQAPGAAAAPALKTITLEGKLDFVDGHPVLVAKDGKTWNIGMPRFYYYAYTDGIKKDAAVKVEGYELPAWPGQTVGAVRVVKATIAGKTYDFTAVMQGFPGFGGGNRGMMGGCGGLYGNGMMGQGGMGRGGIGRGMRGPGR